MKTRKQKQEYLEALAEQFKNAHAAMLVSSPTAMIVISPGRALICSRRNSTPPSVCRLGEEKPSAHSVCLMYWVAVDVPA